MLKTDIEARSAMLRLIFSSLLGSVITWLLCCVIYPMGVWGIAQLLFPYSAEGSLIVGHDRTVIGSALVAQEFASDRYFHPRPSAVEYKADASGGSNLGPKNPGLRDQVKKRMTALGASHENPAPVDLVMASGSGLDPHISLRAALFQVPRVAAARGIPVSRLRSRVAQSIERSGALIGAPERVNVLLLNLALDGEADHQ